MSALKTLLEYYAAEANNLGGHVSGKLARSLASYRTRLFVFFVVLFVVLVVVVGLSAYALGTTMKDPTRLAALASAMGISVGGAVELMRRIWREWSRAELLGILLEEATDADVSMVLGKLIAKL